MEETSSIRALLPRLVRRPPADLAAVLVATVLVDAVTVLPVIRDTALRVPLGLAFVLFVPGYAVVSAIFPRRGPENAFEGDENAGVAARETPDRSRSWWGRIDGVDRIALSVALSVTIVPVIGTAITVRGGFQLGPILLAVSAFTVVATVAAIQRRSAVVPSDRFRIPHREWLTTARSTVLEPATRGEAILNVALIGAVLLALVSVGYTATVLPQDEEFSTIYVLSAGDEEIDADDPSLEIETGVSREVVVGVDNHEERSAAYTVVVVEQALEPGGESEGGDANVLEQRELDRFETEVDDGETWRQEHEVEPTISGENVRVAWLLYVDGDVPDDPSVESADYHAHVWIDDAGDS